ncbi:MAG TPA: hypothetical protein VEM32_02010 [Geobacteraceae bacterium]|nr:hypothetical protein [Geobacteraceae bacterium]
MPLLKRLAQFSVAFLLFSFLAISFHYHGDLADHPACPICKTAKAFSSLKKPALPVLTGHPSTLFPDLPAGEQQVQFRAAAPSLARDWFVSNDESCRRIFMDNSFPSRASPAMPPVF